MNPQHTYVNGGEFVVKLVSSNSCGSDTLIETIEISTLNNINNFSHEYKIQQNTDGTYTILFNANNNIKFEALYTSKGQVIENNHTFVSQISDDKFSLNLKGVSQGIYFVVFKTQNKLFSIKLIQN